VIVAAAMGVLVSGFVVLLRRKKQPAVTITLAATLLFSLGGLAGADQPVSATDAEGFWRTPLNDAANALDLYLRLVNRATSRDRIVSALGNAGREASLSDVTRASRTLKHTLRVIKSTPARLTATTMPVIVHLFGDDGQEGGYSLLFRIDENECKLINGANVTLEVMSMDDFRRRWSGYALVADDARASWWRSAAVGLCVLAAYVWLRSWKLATRRAQTVEGAGSGQPPLAQPLSVPQKGG
jgi:hypothetical protein